MTEKDKKFSFSAFLLDIGLVFLVIAVVIIIILVYPDNYYTIFVKAWDLTLNQLITIIPIFLVSTFLAGIVEVWVEKDIVIRFFKKRGLLTGLIFISVLGILTPGPIFAMFPIVLVLARKGVKPHFLIAFIAGQTMMGPCRIPLELYYLGGTFLIVRTILALLMAIVSGLLTLPISEWLHKDLNKQQSLISSREETTEPSHNITSC